MFLISRRNWSRAIVRMQEVAGEYSSTYEACSTYEGYFSCPAPADVSRKLSVLRWNVWHLTVIVKIFIYTI